MRLRSVSIAAITVAIIIGFGYLAFPRRALAPARNPDPNHIHADFAVFVQGRKIDFSRPQYMEDYKNIGSGSSLKAYIHLHDNNGLVIHSHKPGLTIDDFFRSIGMPIVGDCMTIDTGKDVCPTSGERWRLFMNDGELPFSGTYILKDTDRILLTYGLANDDVSGQLKQVTDDACRYSRTCPERGMPPKEDCIADPNIPCKIVTQ